MSVVLPAPFSPMIAWILPRSTARFTRSLATIAPKRFVIDLSSTACGTIDPRTRRPPPAKSGRRWPRQDGDGCFSVLIRCRSAHRTSLLHSGDADLAGYDVGP